MADVEQKRIYSFRWDRISLLIRFHTPLMPFDEIAFLNLLPNEGYLLTERLPAPPFGAHIAIAGEVGVKGNIRIALNSDLRTLELIGHDINPLLDEFSSLEEMLTKEFHFVPSTIAWYYEFLVDASVETQSQVLSCVAKSFSSLPLITYSSNLLQVPVTNFGIRLVPLGTLPNSANWFEIRIGPEILLPYKHYSVVVVYRHSERERVFQFARSLKDSLERILNFIEKEADENR